MSSIRRCHFLDDTHSLSQDPVADTRLQALRCAEVDPASKQVLKVVLEFQEPEQPNGAIELDQQVNVATLARLVARDRAKEREMRHAEFRVQRALLGPKR